MPCRRVLYHLHNGPRQQLVDLKIHERLRRRRRRHHRDEARRVLLRRRRRRLG